MRRASTSGTFDRAARKTALAWAALGLGFATSGCDIVQGFQNAGDTIFPEQSTHLASPPLRLVAGSYRRIDLALGQRLHLLARAAAGGDSLFAMRYAEPHPCEIASVGSYASTRDPNRSEVLLAYFHESARQGLLHFADTSCRTFDLSVPDARLPLMGETPEAVIVWAGTELRAVDPVQGTSTVLAEQVEDVVVRAFSERSLVRTAGRFQVFGADWKSQGTFGDGIAGLWRAGKVTLYLDKTGLRRLAPGDDDHSVKDTLIAPDVCRIGMQDSNWMTFYSPCGEQRVVAYSESSGSTFQLTTSADPRALRLLPARGSAGRDPAKDPFFFLFLRNIDPATSLGELVVKMPNGDEHLIGKAATLERSDLVETDSQTYGYGFVDVSGPTGRYVYWNGKGELRELAQNAIVRSRRLIIDFDGTIGKAAVVSGDRLAVVAERVPYQGFEYQDANRQWTVVFHDWYGSSGPLSAFAGTFESLAQTPLDQPLLSPKLETIAPSVQIFRTAQLGSVLPGVVYLADYDATTETGRLEYRNTELRFSAVIDHGVSDYLVTKDEVIYSVPFGEHPGIWLTAGK